MIDQQKRIEGRRLRITLTPDEKDTTTWAQVETSGFPDDKLQTFEKRRQVILAYTVPR